MISFLIFFQFLKREKPWTPHATRRALSKISSPGNCLDYVHVVCYSPVCLKSSRCEVCTYWYAQYLSVAFKISFRCEDIINIKKLKLNRDH